MPNDAEDELWNLLDVIHRKSNRLRDEVEHLQNLNKDKNTSGTVGGGSNSGSCSSSGGTGSCSNGDSGSNNNINNNNHNNNRTNIPTTFQDQLDRLSKEDVQILRKERDRLLEKIFDMEKETLANRIKSSKKHDEVETLHLVKRDLEEQLKVALSQKFELNTRIHDMHQHFITKSIPR